MSQCHIKRDDGMFLVGPGSMQVSSMPLVPFRNLTAAMAAINHYRLSATEFCQGDGANDSFTIYHI